MNSFVIRDALTGIPVNLFSRDAFRRIRQTERIFECERKSPLESSDANAPGKTVTPCVRCVYVHFRTADRGNETKTKEEKKNPITVTTKVSCREGTFTTLPSPREARGAERDDWSIDSRARTLLTCT